MAIYLLKTKNKDYELSTSFNTIQRIQRRTDKSIEQLQAEAPNIKLEEKVRLLSDGLENSDERKEFYNYIFSDETPLSPFEINLNLQMFLIDLLTIGMTEEEVEKYFPKKQLKSMMF